MWAGKEFLLTAAGNQSRKFVIVLYYCIRHTKSNDDPPYMSKAQMEAHRKSLIGLTSLSVCLTERFLSSRALGLPRTCVVHQTP
jgi:hypothetical protein